MNIYDKVDFRGRPILVDNQSYRLIDTDSLGLPGYFTLEPKSNTFLDLWSDRVIKYLSFNGKSKGPNIEATVQDSTPLSYEYKEGIVRANVRLGRVYIEKNHKNLEEVCRDLIKLAFRGK